MNSPPPLISIVVPYCGNEYLPHLATRLEQLCAVTQANSNVETLIIDSSISLTLSQSCKATCKTFDAQYHRGPIGTPVFSLAEARNYGAQRARGRVITFQDVDLVVASDFWGRLANFIEQFGIGDFKKIYFPIPCLYLSEEYTVIFQKAPIFSRVERAISAMKNNDKMAIETFAPCSSFIVIDRKYFLSLGGYDLRFSGHGFEDFELHHRILAELNLFKRPGNYYYDCRTWNSPDCCGFRAIFSILGQIPLSMDLIALHPWHARPEELPFYKMNSENGNLLLQVMRQFDQTKTHPEPLAANECHDRAFLFLGRISTDSYSTLRDIFPNLGRPITVSEQLFFQGDTKSLDLPKLKKVLKSHRIEKILFPNPYRNHARLSVYKWCRSNNFPFIVFERGALPNSWFFDPSGFNGDSESYDESRWNHQLSPSQIEDVESYIQWCLSGAETLELQGNRIGGDTLRSALSLNEEKVLFVPLQRPSDTVTTHLAGVAKSCEYFMEFIDGCAEKLSKYGWRVVCKRHPYEKNSMPLNHAQYVDPQTNFLDLLEMADAVAVMNSGVGLYAMMMAKPCYIFSNCFYSIRGVNYQMNEMSEDEFIGKILTRAPFSEVKMHQFIYYLRYRFYSFGHARYRKWIETDGNHRKAATSIDFSEIRLPGDQTLIYDRDREQNITNQIFEILGDENINSSVVE